MSRVVLYVWKWRPTMPNWVVHRNLYISKWKVLFWLCSFLDLLFHAIGPLPPPPTSLLLLSSSPNLVSSHHPLLPHLQKFPYVYHHLARICSESFSLHVNSLGFQRACLFQPSRSDFITFFRLSSLLFLSLVLFLFYFNLLQLTTCLP